MPPTPRTRWTRRYRLIHAAFRAHCAKHNLPCWLCGRPIDYTLPKEHPDAFNADHALPVSTHPHLAEDAANLRPSHKACNERRGNGVPFLPIGQPSEQW